MGIFGCSSTNNNDGEFIEEELLQLQLPCIYIRNINFKVYLTKL